MASQMVHALLPSSCSKSINANMNVRGPERKRCVGTKSIGDAHSSSIVGKITSDYHRPILARSATVPIGAIGRSPGPAPEREGKNRPAGIGATQRISALPCVIGWGAEVTDMIDQKVEAITGRGAGPIDTINQIAKPAFTAGSKTWPMLG